MEYTASNGIDTAPIKITRNKLTQLQDLHLGTLIYNEYTKSLMSDRVFAQYATEKLSFLVAAKHVMSRRSSYGIKANMEVRAAAKTAAKEERKAIAQLKSPGTISQRVANLETQVLGLTVKMNRLLKKQ